MKGKTTYSDAIEKVMLRNGYFAPLKLIYNEIWKFKDKGKIKGLTPKATIQERVQRDPRFTRIGLGVYALTEYIDKLPKEPIATTTIQKKEKKHASIQGMLLEIGNSKDYVKDTYTNDKKWIFQNKSLGSLATIDRIPLFTYKKIIDDSVRFADVIWFNKRGFPDTIFEVEESTDFRGAFVKFCELQDFNTSFYCVSDENRRSKFEKEINKSAFESINNRCRFFSYDEIENDYRIAITKTYLKI